jgi:DNA modification methylase
MIEMTPEAAMLIARPVVIGDATLYTGDVLSVLAALPEESVHCVVTSPPYYGLRDYGVPGQIGLEESPAEYIEKMVEVFRGVRRVMRKDATLWLNVGDSYAGSGKGPSNSLNKNNPHSHEAALTMRGMNPLEGTPTEWLSVPEGMKPKDLMGIPWMLAFALRADGWYLRSDIIWAKPNPMPESVTDRPTKAHEYLFLLSKSPRYFYDAEAIREITGHEATAEEYEEARKETWPSGGIERHAGAYKNAHAPALTHPAGRNRRTVWTIATEPYPEAHFATFPRKLVQPCILAGCPIGGTVLDPFGGSGTTAEVALEYGRRAILIELKPEYVELQRKRLAPVAGRPMLDFTEAMS